MILYILLCGYPPFYGRDANSIYNKILKGDYSFNSKFYTKYGRRPLFYILNIYTNHLFGLGKEWSSVSKAAKDLIKKMLQKSAGNRLTAAEALSDPWIRSFQRGGSGIAGV